MAWGALLIPLDVRTTDKSLVIFAASSLTDGFQDRAILRRNYPQLPIQLSFAGNQTLRLPIEQGAAADMIATANKDHLDMKTNDTSIKAGYLPTTDWRSSFPSVSN